MIILAKRMMNYPILIFNLVSIGFDYNAYMKILSANVCNQLRTFSDYQPFCRGNYRC
jgi:hypothetical protein